MSELFNPGSVNAKLDELGDWHATFPGRTPEQVLMEWRASEIVPGCLICPKCKYQLSRSLLCAQTGAVGANISNVIEYCPNDGHKMRPLKWKERCEDLAKAAEQQVKRAADAEQKNHKADLREALGALAAALEIIDACEDNPLRCTMPKGPRYIEIQQTLLRLSGV